MITPFYQEDYATVFLGDARRVLKELPEASIDMVMCSPPYFGLRRYLCEPSIWDGDENCMHFFGDNIVRRDRGTAKGTTAQVGNQLKEVSGVETQQGQFCLKCHAWRGVLGMEPTPDLYIQHLVGIFDLVRRVLKPTGTLWVNLGDSYAGASTVRSNDKDTVVRFPLAGDTERVRGILVGAPAKSLIGIPARFQLAMIDKGFICRNDIIWWKRSCMPESVRDRFTRDFEHIFMFAVQGKYYFEQQFETAIVGYRSADFIPNSQHDKSANASTAATAASPNNRSSEYVNSRNARTVWHGNEPLPYRLKENIPKEQLEWLIKTFCEPYTVPQGDVWDVTSQGTGLEHYASYPIELCRRPILAGCPEYICPACTKPRVKMYDHTNMVINRSDHAEKSGIRIMSSGTMVSPTENEFIGYSDCGCLIDGKPITLEQCIPGVVLDLFAGTGTTGIMAKLLGRKSILIDISETYCEMAVKRLQSVVRQGEMR